MNSDGSEDYSFNLRSIERTVRYMTRLQRALSLNIRIHRPHGRIDDGDIYLFNHFARFETFIPQYLIYQQTGMLSRSVASAEFFVNPTLGRYLRGVGAMPNNHPRLLPFLAAELLRGRKVVIFPGRRHGQGPPGGRRPRWLFGLFADGSGSPPSAFRRRGAGADAGLLQGRGAGPARSGRSLDRWADQLSMGADELAAAAARPTRLVPGNITFYPLRVDEWRIYRATESLAKLNQRAAEELLIESNILLRNTDMDLRLGHSILPERGRSARWHRTVLAAIEDAADLEAFFALAADRQTEPETLFHHVLQRRIARLRDQSAPAIYGQLTVNLSHLAASLMQHCLAQGITEMAQARFHKALFLADQDPAAEPGLHLHRGLASPDRYAGLIGGSCRGFNEFITMAERTHALQREPFSYRFTEKLLQPTSLDTVRRENPVQVYANEAAPVPQVLAAAAQGLAAVGQCDDRALARLLFEEELAALRWARDHFSHAKFAEINAAETATANPEPYWLNQRDDTRLGVLLVHGLLASPAELAALGQQIANSGHMVLGVRLHGHGTSPWDLKTSRWQDWLASVQRGLLILEPFVDRICLVGFSTGGALSLIAAAAQPVQLAAVVACSAPYKMKNRNLMAVPLVNSANQIVRRLSERDGVMLFRRNQSEHPDINYFNIPISALNELRHMIDHLDSEFPRIAVPTLMLQGTDDQVVDSVSAAMIAEKLTAARWKRVVMIESNRHGILNEDIGDSRGAVLRFLASLEVA